MEEVQLISKLRTALDTKRGDDLVVGLVPTMGYLHEGHVSLMQQARKQCDVVVATIFVNPLQFGANEDLSSYPRDLNRDRQLAQNAGVDFLFVPDVKEMYPQEIATTVSVAGVSAGMEGASRPTHFSGVATVVAKIFNIVGPCRAYFGEKDFQQLVVVKRMVDDLSFPVEVLGCETVREADGLALSSRNSYLSPAERKAATVLKRALDVGASVIQDGQRNTKNVCQRMVDVVASEPLAKLDYIEIADSATLEPIPDLGAYAGETVRLLIAAQLGAPRLLDNRAVQVPFASSTTESDS